MGADTFFIHKRKLCEASSCHHSPPHVHAPSLTPTVIMKIRKILELTKDCSYFLKGLIALLISRYFAIVNFCSQISIVQIEYFKYHNCYN